MIGLVTATLFMALLTIVGITQVLIAQDGQPHSSRAPLPRHAGQTRRRAPVAALEAGPKPINPPMGPAGLAAATPQAGKAAASPLPLCIETPALYETGPLPILCLHDEDWWDQ